MVRIEPGRHSRTLADALFSICIDMIQSTVVTYRVTKNRTYLGRPGPRANPHFEQKLRALGVVPERLWWGLMTLFPRKVEFLIDEVERQPPNRVLEVGCGTSTVVFAALAEKFGFSVLSLENHGGAVKYVQSMLDELSCSRRVTIQKCGFVRRNYPNGDKYRWYDADLERAGGLFDFVFIDGPMGTLVGRNGALPEIEPYLAENHRIYLDDSERAHEKHCIEEWRRHYPEFLVEKVPTCQGIARLTVSK